MRSRSQATVGYKWPRIVCRGNLTGGILEATIVDPALDVQWLKLYEIPIHRRCISIFSQETGKRNKTSLRLRVYMGDVPHDQTAVFGDTSKYAANKCWNNLAPIKLVFTPEKPRASNTCGSAGVGPMRRGDRNDTASRRLALESLSGRTGSNASTYQIYKSWSFNAKLASRRDEDAVATLCVIVIQIFDRGRARLLLVPKLHRAFRKHLKNALPI
ncbi:hypothetical protein EVAR_61333_1 [Eumeta japonica]|uniref:Uncharacterized protein n=1 Tax=Eumeta variegata TaxID=151549 RepID=A0A4C1Y0Z6_EUMVA|nr:hypothetical protein EVAR_61333_1 [Eumeta japonica]